MSPRSRCRIPQPLSGKTFSSGRRKISLAALPQLLLLTLTLALLFPQPSRSIHLDIHVPLPQGCLEYYALLANRLLREASRPGATILPSSSSSSSQSNTETGADQTGKDEEEEVSQPSEHVDLFMRHTPHVTLYLADFDLEVEEEAADDTDANGDAGRTANDSIDQAARALNLTKVAAFKDAIASLNFTEIISGWNCPLTFSVPEEDRNPNSPSSSFYKINGAYVMLPISNTPCLQTLSTTLLHALQSYLKHPIVVPSWVASLTEPVRSASIFRSRTYGSPNVLEGFDPHVTVGFDETGVRVSGAAQDNDADSSSERSNLQWRVDTMEEWNEAYRQERGTCMDEVQGIALGKTGVGGTVLAGSRMGYWKFEETKKVDVSVSQGAHGNDFYAAVD
mmetsp:Transcript_29728/g.64010  ORF Transcript_29728/g.64010 Transcript_29728/m.64010 type:complete len:394 (+) Transcript_29728:133-1314(+)